MEGDAWAGGAAAAGGGAVGLGGDNGGDESHETRCKAGASSWRFVNPNEAHPTAQSTGLRFSMKAVCTMLVSVLAAATAFHVVAVPRGVVVSTTLAPPVIICPDALALCSGAGATQPEDGHASAARASTAAAAGTRAASHAGPRAVWQAPVGMMAKLELPGGSDTEVQTSKGVFVKLTDLTPQFSLFFTLWCINHFTHVVGGPVPPTGWNGPY